MAKTHTSTEVKNRWKKKAYKLYQVSLRYDSDQLLIEFIENNKERIGMTQIFREALEQYIETNSGA